MKTNKLIPAFVSVLPLMATLCSCSTFYLKKPADTNLDFWITERAEHQEFEEKGCTLLPGWFGAAEYLDHRYVAEESVKKLSFKKCFLGCDGYSKEQGFTATDFYTARLNSVVSENSQQKIILADSSEFNSPAVVAVSKLENVTAIVTDSNIDEQMKQHFTENNIQIFI